MRGKSNILKNILTGKWLDKGIKTKNLYFILFVVFLMVMLVYNRYRAEELIVEKNKIKETTEILHSKYTKSRAKLMSSVTERKTAQDSIIIKKGLKIPKNPVKQIIIKK